MKNVAVEAGVSVMTVSLALRNHPRISPATQQRIQAVAKRLGYRSNPMVASLMTHIRSSRPVPYQANLGFLVDDFQTWKSRPFFQAAHKGIIDRAEDLGFLVDTFFLDEKSLHRGRLERVLESRNIQGVILAPLMKAGNLDQMNWSQWSAAALGNSLLSPRIHRVTHHQFHGMMLILENLIRKGYRRIGLALEKQVDDKVDRNWTSCLTGYQLRIPAKDRVPVYLSNLDPKPLSAWLKKHRPDVVIGHEGLYFWLNQLGIRIPEELSYANVSLPSELRANFSGLDQNWKLVGAAAVDSVVAQIYRNERGVPENPKTIMLEGTWVDGETAPGIRQAIQKERSNFRKFPKLPRAAPGRSEPKPHS